MVDANHDMSIYLEALKANSLKLKYIIDTHTHADHDTLSGELALKTGAAVAMHRNYTVQRSLGEGFSANPDVASHLAFNAAVNIDIELDHGSVLKVGEVDIKVIYTPGHTTDSVSLMLPERLLITGDSLMIGQCGRPDLPGGDGSVLFDSIFDRIMSLDRNTLVCPGHDYKGNVSTTIGYESVNNPFLQYKTREEFVAYTKKVFTGVSSGGKLQCSITPPQDSPAPPADKSPSPMANQMCSAIEYYIRNVPTHWNLIEARELMEYIGEKRDMFLLDVRTPQEFASGSIRGSVNIPVSDLPNRIKELPSDLERPVVVICRSGARSAYALMFLRGYGYSHVKSLDLGIHHWTQLGYPLYKETA